MKKKELVERLAYLEDFSILNDDIYELFQLKKPHARKIYSIDKDRRVPSLFHESRGEAQYRSISVLTYTVVCLLAQSNMRKPSHKQMEALLRMSGYCGEQMDQFVSENPAMSELAVLKQELMPVVYLLTRMLREALIDEQKTRGKQKKFKTGVDSPDGQTTYDVNSPMGKLQRMVTYMRENSILHVLSNNAKDYEEFVVEFADMICKKRIASSEIDSVEAEVKRLDEQFARDLMRIIERAGKFRKNSTPPRAPLAYPLTIPNTSKPTSALEQKITHGLTPTLEDMRQVLPADLLKEAETLLRRDKKRTEVFNQLVDAHADVIDGCNEEWNAQTGSFYMPAVAEGAFISLLNGDDLYQTNLGLQIMIQIGMNANLPLRLFPIPELEDEEEWDYTFPEENDKKLCSRILDEDDTMEQTVGDLTMTFPLTSVISRIAAIPFSGPLVVRKSLIKMFREHGFSERKARDFAVIIATLDHVSYDLHDWQVGKLYFSDFYGDNSAVEIPVAVDERVETAENRTRNAEAECKRLEQLNQKQRHEVNQQIRENERLQEQLRQAQEELAQLKTIDRHVEDEPQSEELDFPYHTDKRIVVYGGHEIFHKELLKLLPDVRIMEMSAHIDLDVVRNADIVFLQCNKTSHSAYWSVRDGCKAAGVPYYYLNYASAKKCAMEMIGRISAL